jgi:putative flippase GtrA
MLQFIRFTIVGTSGYTLNVGTFALAHRMIDYRLAAAVAFLVAVTNNFMWNRAWTFRDARGGHAGFQAMRFFLVSLVGFAWGLLVLDTLVHAGLDPVAAQAISIITAMPMSFLGNKLWSFRATA